MPMDPPQSMCVGVNWYGNSPQHTWIEVDTCAFKQGLIWFILSSFCLKLSLIIQSMCLEHCMVGKHWNKQYASMWKYHIQCLLLQNIFSKSQQQNNPSSIREKKKRTGRQSTRGAKCYRKCPQQLRWPSAWSCHLSWLEPWPPPSAAAEPMKRHTELWANKCAELPKNQTKRESSAYLSHLEALDKGVDERKGEEGRERQRSYARECPAMGLCAYKEKKPKLMLLVDSFI